MNTQALIDTAQQVFVPTYTRPPFILTRGEGMYVYDADGKRYLDCTAGIAVNALGYSDSEVVRTIENAAGGLLHTSNLYYTEPQIELAQALVEHSFADRVFFCNSGTESIETALKFARKFAYERGDKKRTGFVAFSGSFHGRSIGSLSLTDSEKYQAPYRPLMPGATFAKFNNIGSARAAITDETAAVIVEPVQGEGGIHPAHEDFLHSLRELCDQHGALLIFDEIQCGLGRTGKLWAHEHFGVSPDIMALAKPLAAGLPIGATLVTEAIAQSLHPGDHGSTFAGGPLITSVALTVFNRIRQPAFLQSIVENGAYLIERLCEINSPHIQEVRGKGLMVGVELDVDAGQVIERGYDHGLLLIKARERVVRFVPPLIVERTHIDEMIDGLAHILEKL